MKKISVVIAAYDEEENVEALLRRLHATLEGMGVAWEVILVVEGEDRTRQIVDGLMQELGDAVRMLYREQPSGLGAAFRRGFAAVSDDSEAVVTLDADLNHQPEEIPALLDALERSGADIVIGSRFVDGSRVEGTPLWKRFLSGTMNLLMWALYGLSARDKTSGFRVYRTETLRRIAYRNEDFAFLPEILIGAHRVGAVIVERPIHFVFRTQGVSKLRFWRTSMSYLALLRTRFDRWSLLAAGLLAIGVAVRVLAAFPLHRFPADADCALTGITALRVLHGDMPVFLSGTRIGSLEGYLVALLFLLFGASRFALALLPVCLGTSLLVSAYWLLRRLAGRQAACAGLLVLAMPPPGFLFWTYMPNGYPMIVLLALLVLVQVVRVADRPSSTWNGVLLGLLMGLAWWQSPLTLSCSLPALVWLAVRRRRRILRARFVAALGAGFVGGAFPWLAYNIRYPLASFRVGWGLKAADPRGWGDNAVYALESLRQLLAAGGPGRFPPTGWVAIARQTSELALLAAAVAVLMVLPLVARRRDSFKRWDVLPLFAGVLVTVLVLNVFSAAGSLRGLTARYVLPVYLLLPVAFAACFSLGRRARPWVVVAVVAIAVNHLALYDWPWTEERRHWRASMEVDNQIVEVLEREQADVLVGGYWSVYAFNFLAADVLVAALPCELGADHYRYAKRLERDGSYRWALLGGGGFGASWPARLGLDADVYHFDGGLSLYMTQPVQPGPEDFFHRAVNACITSR